MIANVATRSFEVSVANEDIQISEDLPSDLSVTKANDHRRSRGSEFGCRVSVASMERSRSGESDSERSEMNSGITTNDVRSESFFRIH